MTPKPQVSPKRALISGAFWTVGTRWMVKGLGFVSTLIVARLLLPADYGIVAMATLAAGLIQAMLDFGASTALLRKGAVTQAEIDSAWTLRLLEGCAIGLLLLGVAQPSALYFKEPRVEAVMWVLAACMVISSASNIGFTLAQKEFNFSLQFRHNLICKSMGVFSTIAAAYLLRDYRALVIGVVTGYVSGCVMSYVMHPYRPRWNTTQIGEIWAVTKWLMLAGVGGFFLRKSDELIAARIGTTGEYGLYNVGADLGQLPTGELGPAMLRAFLPVLSSIQDDVARTNQAVLKTLSAVNTITLPVGLGFAAVATPATVLLLGAQWVEAAPFVALFALAGVVQFAASPLSTLLVLRGHTRLQNHIVWAEFAVFVLCSLVLVPQLHLPGLVWARIAASGVNAMVTALCASLYCKLALSAMVKVLLRPTLGAVSMYLLVSLVMPWVPGSAWSLAICVTLGALAYTSWTLLTWFAAGRPEGLESTIYDFLASGKRA
ncbi:lipopolysaccharide biosynthesis protein [Rhodoferax sp. BLA1]|uniref:lipopolysaccharide biosynthesis protein n=1 Tax=Rhodoferax sp. BLA1 TaxID=2576062 RepID=UPI0015D373C7|nr:lipopolysaccharide biosynthesis protein [Rhodoferax sp. BLA1]